SVMFPVIAPAAVPPVALGVFVPPCPPHAAARTKATVSSVIALSFILPFDLSFQCASVERICFSGPPLSRFASPPVRYLPSRRPGRETSWTLLASTRAEVARSAERSAHAAQLRRARGSGGALRRDLFRRWAEIGRA